MHSSRRRGSGGSPVLGGGFEWGLVRCSEMAKDGKVLNGEFNRFFDRALELDKWGQIEEAADAYSKCGRFAGVC